MKTRIISLLTAGLLCGAATAHGITAPDYFSLETSNPFIQVGDTFTVDVSLTNLNAYGGDLTRFGFTVNPSFSLSHISFLGSTLDAAFVDINGGLFANTFIGGSSAGIPPIGDIHLATLSFLATDIGVDALILSGQLDSFDTLNGLVFTYPNNGGGSHGPINKSFEITVNPRIVAVPEPSTYGLAGAGLVLALIVLRKRKSPRTPAQA